MAVFFTGCTHFGHANINKLANRPFDSVEEMDEVLIQNWNHTVSRDDIVYHLGDFAFKNHQDYHRRLNGRLIVIKGNHDRKLPDDIESTPYLRLSQKELGADRSLVLFHYPIEEWDGWYRNTLHLHCHQHSDQLVSGPRRFNVSVEATGYTPLHLSQIISHPNADAALQR